MYKKSTKICMLTNILSKIAEKTIINKLFLLHYVPQNNERDHGGTVVINTLASHL